MEDNRPLKQSNLSNWMKKGSSEVVQKSEKLDSNALKRTLSDTDDRLKKKPSIAIAEVPSHIQNKEVINMCHFMTKEWMALLNDHLITTGFETLCMFVASQRQSKTVYPPEQKVFSWMHFCSPQNIKVVILGQDPYHEPDQAHGLAFSVPPSIRPPPSLVNIFKELVKDIPGFKTPLSGELTGWAKQGVLLLNACLTVTKGAANSHANKGWEAFTTHVIKKLSSNYGVPATDDKPTKDGIIFLLWGKSAEAKLQLIDTSKHYGLVTSHPSPLSVRRGFDGCKHFSKTNSLLSSMGKKEIDWCQLSN